ncbi:hypothetical protein [Pseudomonas sp. 2(2015)]|uniref:hypothetical protein n=1 Tax=Pseudomonas sp. 2(2015) TaxID=1619950 RepID=UPI000A57E24E|nr:hypothetical protein [Pseudomonas sp. 2(2015)]
MDITSIPPTVFVAFGVITAALLAGFFSVMNMVSAKENKVSEFRLAWVDGLRDEIAEYTSAAQELVRASASFEPDSFHTPEEKHKLMVEWYKETRTAFSRAVESLTKIQLRLNHQHVLNNPKSPEAQLMAAVQTARESAVNENLDNVLDSCADIRKAAGPILKNTWDLVKHGEAGYRRIRAYSMVTIAVGFYALVTACAVIGIKTFSTDQSEKQETQAHQVSKPIQNYSPSPLRIQSKPTD